MQIQATDPSSIFAASTAPSSSSGSNNSVSAASAAALSGSMPTESNFLQLLVAQMKYQDPTNPQDATQYVSELAQFSQLEQTIGIKNDADTISQDLTPATSTTSTTPTAATTANPLTPALPTITNPTPNF